MVNKSKYIEVNLTESKNFLLSVKYFFVTLVLFFIANSAPTSATTLTNTEDELTQDTQEVANLSFMQQLKLADNNKRSNPLIFKKVLKELRKKEHLLTTDEYHLLNLLYSYSYTYSGQHNKAEEQLLQLLQEKTNQEIKFRSNYLMIYVMAAKQDWSNGLRYVANNLNYIEKISKNKHYQDGLISTIIFYNQIKQYDLALRYIKLLAEEELSNTNNCFLQQLNLEVKFNQNTLKANDPLINKAISTCQIAKFKIVEHIIRTYKAKLLIDYQNANNSLNELLPYLQDAKKTHYPMLLAEIYNTITNAYLQLNNLKKAKFFANEAVKINKNGTNLLQGVDTYYLLYQIAKAENNPTLALEYYEKYAEIEKANLEGEKAKHMAFQLAQHQAFEQEAEIKLLNEKNTLLETKQALSEAEVANTRLIIAFLVVSLILIALWGGRLYKAHKRIKELAEYDALTGIFNRGHFTHVANSALKYCQNAEQDLSVIIFDLDNFKTVNDNYGHATGDWALKEATKVCKNLGRQNDIFARIGGEEFCILLPSCNIRSAALRAEECRHAIEDIITEASGHDFRITASFGVTDAKTSGFNLEKLLADADEAAYTSKHSGRNRVTVYEIENTPKQAQLDGSWSIT